ncbi:DUF1854 domain-containing protein [Paenibacillus glacialis]|uniref:DUF1854 domain-containing protein n=1 Tax=Paenibacillus glacialis TaxID=494026 RepID=A0A168P014_9BACL|nr:DUF1854 domain-containing protein [Paenibacillus glacialis]OAB46259.1 hypothetical protein PGLA_02445 [Paenibacillus glacialis]
MIQLLRDLDGVLEIEKDGRRYTGVKLIRTFPLTMPNQYISVRLANDEEITMIADLSLLEEDSRMEAEQELQRYYMIHIISNIVSLKRSGSEWLWVVDTSYGRTYFRMNEMHESLHPLSLVSWILCDIEGRRYIITNIHELDENSLKQWEKIN